MIGLVAGFLAALTLWFYLLVIVVPQCLDRLEMCLWKRLGGTGPPPGRD